MDLEGARKFMRAHHRAAVVKMKNLGQDLLVRLSEGSSRGIRFG